uniref:dCTP pyrophosphatase 1-like n=1 Tax=Tanacetum cinerariifolium TaxID=118510 RepID=A0A6L2JK69_TANCI|nr:dCTP pyrophosphatase 1-like [Tanacetum cinerariifolium]
MLQDLIVNWKKSSQHLRHLRFFVLLDLSGNHISGEIPASLGNLKALQQLNISHNRISGNIPLSLGNLVRMESLDVSHNELSGSIPQSLGQLGNFTILDVSSNMLKGKIPHGRQIDTMNELSYFQNNSKLCGTQIKVTCPDDIPSPEGRNIGNQIIQNAVQNLRVQNIRNQNGLIGVQGNGNQNQIRNGNLVAARAEGNAAGKNGNQIRCYNCRGIAQKEEAGIQLQAEEFDLMAAAADLDEIEETDWLRFDEDEVDIDEGERLFLEQALRWIPEGVPMARNDGNIFTFDDIERNEGEKGLVEGDGPTVVTGGPVASMATLPFVPKVQVGLLVEARFTNLNLEVDCGLQDQMGRKDYERPTTTSLDVLNSLSSKVATTKCVGAELFERFKLIAESDRSNAPYDPGGTGLIPGETTHEVKLFRRVMVTLINRSRVDVPFDPAALIAGNMTSAENEVTLSELKKKMADFAKERDWDQFHSPRNLLLALVGEVGELSEIFQWKGEVPRGLPDWEDKEKQHLGEELSDVLLYLVRLSDICGVDLGKAALRKLEINAIKYPVNLCKGSSKKHDQIINNNSSSIKEDVSHDSV